MALAVRAAQLKDAKAITRWVLITVVLGVAFLGVKAYEYTAEYHEQLVPGFNFNAAILRRSRRCLTTSAAASGCSCACTSS